MADEQQNEGLSFIERMDKIAAGFLDKAEKAETSDAERVKCFDRALAWQKQRAKLIPKGSGERMKEMGHGFATSDRKRDSGRAAQGTPSGGSSGAGAKAAAGGNSDGKEIRRIIDTLPDFGGDPGRNSPGAKREGGLAASAAGGDRPDGMGDAN